MVDETKRFKLILNTINKSIENTKLLDFFNNLSSDEILLIHEIFEDVLEIETLDKIFETGNIKELEKFMTKRKNYPALFNYCDNEGNHFIMKLYTSMILEHNVEYRKVSGCFNEAINIGLLNSKVNNNGENILLLLAKAGDKTMLRRILLDYELIELFDMKHKDNENQTIFHYLIRHKMFSVTFDIYLYNLMKHMVEGDEDMVISLLKVIKKIDRQYLSSILTHSYCIPRSYSSFVKQKINYENNDDRMFYSGMHYTLTHYLVKFRMFRSIYTVKELIDPIYFNEIIHDNHVLDCLYIYIFYMNTANELFDFLVEKTNYGFFKDIDTFVVKQMKTDDKNRDKYCKITKNIHDFLIKCQNNQKDRFIEENNYLNYTHDNIELLFYMTNGKFDGF